MAGARGRSAGPLIAPAMTWLHYLVVGLACLVPPATGMLVAALVDWVVWDVLLCERRFDSRHGN